MTESMLEVTDSLEKCKLYKAVEIENIEEIKEESPMIKVRGFVDSIRATGKILFFVLRDQLESVQCICFLGKNPSEERLDWFNGNKKIPHETFVEIQGTLTKVQTPIQACTIKHLEINMDQIKIYGPVIEKLPFNPKDIINKDEESRAKVGYNVRLDNRFLDLRIPSSHCIARIIDSTYFAFRGFLRKEGFLEIKSPKIIQSGSEGGANLFEMKYFNQKAYLAQSPQLYKQMAIIGGLKKVYEVGHVYRAEVSNINRYLSEFTGLDIEMEMKGDYIDFIKYLHSLFVSIFEFLKNECSKELEIIREYSPFEDLVYRKEPVIISHQESVEMLKKEGYEIGFEDDFSREQEKALGSIVKKIHGVDVFVVKDYPKDVRAFYTYVNPSTGKTHSYDFIMRGEEILSGAQRQNDHGLLKAAIQEKGISVESLNNYLEPFKFGAPPHIGCGIGLERLLKAFFKFDDIRYFSLFPRDPNRLCP